MTRCAGEAGRGVGESGAGTARAPRLDRRQARRVAGRVERRWHGSAAAGVAAAVGIGVLWIAGTGFPRIVEHGAGRDGSLGRKGDPGMKNGVIQAVAAAAMVTGAASAQADAVQWRVEDGGNGHWYRAELPAGRDWAAWRTVALATGADLATVTSNAERNFICSSVLSGFSGSTNGGNVLLGAFQEPTDPEPSGFRWVSGEPFDQSWFGPGSPSNSPDFDPNGEDAIAMYGPGGDAGGIPGYSCNWNDVSLRGTGQGALIEWSADCNSDGIVDFGQIRAGELDDANANSIPDCCEQGTPCDCPSDLNGDGVVNGADIGAILAFWGPNPVFAAADITRDGQVNGADLGALLSAWGPCGQ